MLQSLQIQNFQVHQRLKIQFDQPITTILGRSDIGKSAILRALELVMLNQPQGDAYIRDGSKGASVKLAVDGQTITRQRTKNENLYKIGDAVYKSFGTGVPEPIAKILNVSEINFQGQHDSPFWLSLSSGEVSRQLNKIVDLGIIDQSLKSIKSQSRTAKERIQVCHERLKESQTKQEKLQWVVQAEQDWEQVKQLDADRRERLASVERLRGIRQTLRSLKQTAQNANQRALSGSKVIESGKRLEDGFRQKEKLRKILQRLNRSVEIVSTVPDGAKLDQLAGVCEEKQRGIKPIRRLMKQLKSLDSELERRESELTEANENLEGLTQGEVCPICGK